ncbi:MAG: tetratricopeptide repeat protein [Beijerinckiaceae bacterium]|nr:tetratricopeptide repeat protein [Beijerinckiaceae bacterium]
MTILHDASGAGTTIASPAALAHWNDMIEQVLAHAAAAPTSLAAALDADPEFALGHAAKGLMLLTLARRELVADAAAELAIAERLAALNPVTPRERYYIEALSFWLARRPDLAAERLDAAMALDPCDVLAAKLVHAIRFMMGDLTGLLASARSHVAAYGTTSLHSGYLLGCLAFATEENGDHALAERLGRHALELSPRDAWGRHCVAHVMEMTGRASEGARWLADGRASWSHCNNFAFHLSWHEALFHLELGHHGAALDLYDHDVRARKTDDYRDIANAASLLQRLEFAGVEVGHRWHELADLAASRIEDRTLVFADLHYALALAGAGREAEAGALSLGLQRDSRLGHDARLARVVGAPVTDAIRAFRSRRYGEAARLLMGVRGTLAQVGGSHAQRDIFEQMLIESAIRSGDTALTERLLGQRLASRHGHNHFAASRLANLAHASRRPAGRVAAALVALAPSAALH